MHFLTAKWEDLLLANYTVDPACLENLIPPGTELDTHEGVCYVSLVAFIFRKTRVIGLPVPFHLNFEEVNLRFYIRPVSDPGQRAVAFIREIVPSRVIPLISNTLFKEHYVSMRMTHEIGYPYATYRWGKSLEHRISAQIHADAEIPAPGSINEFITEHYHGYTAHPAGTLHYRVEHPQWQVAEVTDYEIDVDFSSCYGSEFAFLNQQKPANVCYTAGSAVSVSFPSQLK